jgi:hypothetical protein
LRTDVVRAFAHQDRIEHTVRSGETERSSRWRWKRLWEVGEQVVHMLALHRE